MDTILFILAVAGVLAVLRRLALAAFGLLRRGVDNVMAGELADVRARRGDLTGLSEADARRQRTRRAQLAALGVFSFWVLLLAAPALTPWPRVIYAAYALLWLVPRGPVRTT